MAQGAERPRSTPTAPWSERAHRGVVPELGRWIVPAPAAAPPAPRERGAHWGVNGMLNLVDRVRHYGCRSSALGQENAREGSRRGKLSGDRLIARGSWKMTQLTDF